MDGALLKVGYEEKRERVYVRNEIMTFEIERSNHNIETQK